MVRPTRLGRSQPILTYGLGYTPDADIGDEPDPIDLALEALMYVPVNVGGEEPAFVQSATGRAGGGLYVTATFAATPSVGSLLVAFVAHRNDTGQTDTISGWTAVDMSPGPDWPCGMFYRIAEASEPTTVTVTSSATGSQMILWVGEFAAAGAPDAISVVDDTTSAATTTVTPVDSPSLLVSGVSIRTDTNGTTLAPAGTMTEDFEGWFDVANQNGPLIAVNYEVITTAAGAETVGSTGGGGSRKAVIAAAFGGPASDVFWVPADLVNDVDDATYELVDDLTEVLRVEFDAARRFASARLRIALTTAGSVTYTIQGANASDYSDAVAVASTAFTATGSLTAQTVTFAWVQTTGYQYYRLVASAADIIRIHTFSLYEAPEGVSYHPDLTGRDVAASHPASAVTVSPTVAGGATVQTALEGLEAATAVGLKVADIETHHRFVITAHMGDVNATDGYPEGTLEAYRLAVRNGAHRVDIDCRLTSDNVWVSMHDSTVDRTMNISGAVSSLSLATIQAGHINGGTGYNAGRHGTTLDAPTVAAIISALAPYDCTFQLENKVATDASATSLAQLAVAQGVAHRSLITADTSEVAAIEAVSTDIGIIGDRATANDWATPTWSTITSASVPYGYAPRKVSGVVPRTDYGTADETAIVQQLWGYGARGITSNDIPAAVAAWQALEYGASADEHVADTTDAHDATAISIVDAGSYFTGTTAEAALQELGSDVAALGSAAAGHYEVIVSGTAPPVAVTNIAEDDWLYGFVPD